MYLFQVIQKLSSGDKNLFINYRDSKLTRLLQVTCPLIFKSKLIWKTFS